MEKLNKAVLFLMISLSFFSCGKQKAADFRKAILQEKQISRILIHEKGSESRKLDYLIQHDFNKALSVVDTQETEFDAIIKQIEALQPDDLAMGQQLKQTAAGYYKSLKELHLYSRQEIAQEITIKNAKGKQLDKELDRLLELSKEKRKLYQNVYDAERLFSDAMRKFNEANDLDPV